MATEFPIDPEFGRNEPPAPEDQGMEVELDLEESSIEELPDGSAVVTMDNFKGPDEDEDFYSNLAEDIDPWELDKISLRYLGLIDKDKEARSQRDKQYE